MEGKRKKLATAVDNMENQENWTFKTSLSYIIQAISDCLRSLSNCNNKMVGPGEMALVKSRCYPRIPSLHMVDHDHQ